MWDTITRNPIPVFSLWPIDLSNECAWPLSVIYYFIRKLAAMLLYLACKYTLSLQSCFLRLGSMAFSRTSQDVQSWAKTGSTRSSWQRNIERAKEVLCSLLLRLSFFFQCAESYIVSVSLQKYTPPTSKFFQSPKRRPAGGITKAEKGHQTKK